MQTFHSVGASSLPQFRLPAPYRYVDSSLEPQEGWARQRWMTVFGQRLAALRADHDLVESMLIAESLWDDLTHHDPEIAAEMEYETDPDH